MSGPNAEPATERLITGFHSDEQGDWVAELSCGHDQHVRHRPPFQWREWVVDDAGRAARLNTPLPCPLCDRAELPASLRPVRTTAVWDETTMPGGLRRQHRVAAGAWALIVVDDGRLRFRAATHPPMDRVLVAGSTQPIPPDIVHGVEPVGSVRFAIQFFAIDRTPPTPESQAVREDG